MNNEVIESEYLPLQAIKLQPSTDIEIEASPYKDIRIEDRQVETKDIKKLHSQINYSNTVLTIMTKQLTRMENSTSSSYHKEVPSSSRPVKPIYKLFNVPQKELDAHKLKSDIDIKIDELKIKLEELNKNSINTLELNKIKTYPKPRNYYNRPTPTDVQFEERGN